MAEHLRRDYALAATSLNRLTTAIRIASRAPQIEHLHEERGKHALEDMRHIESQDERKTPSHDDALIALRCMRPRTSG